MNKPILQVASVVVFRGDSVLLVRHTNSKHIEGIYGLPGGRCGDGEPPAETARRELEEETGLTTTTDDLMPLPAPFEAEVTFRNGEIKRCEMHVFLCTRYRGEVRNTAHEIPEWIPLTKVARLPLLPNVENAIREGLSVK